MGARSGLTNKPKQPSRRAHLPGGHFSVPLPGLASMPYPYLDPSRPLEANLEGLRLLGGFLVTFHARPARLELAYEPD
jgi:hypothetical protein